MDKFTEAGYLIPYMFQMLPTDYTLSSMQPIILEEQQALKIDNLEDTL